MEYNITLQLKHQNKVLDLKLSGNTTLLDFKQFLEEHQFVEKQIPIVIYSHTKKSIISMENVNATLESILGQNYADVIEIHYSPENQQAKLLKVNILASLENGLQAKFELQILNIQTLNDLENLIFQYYSYDRKQIAIELYIFNQCMDAAYKRQQTLHQLHVIDQTTIEARVRFQGGNSQL